MYSNTKNGLENQVVKMANTLVKKSTRFSVVQQKLFYVSLSMIKNGVNDKCEVEIDKEELFEFMGLTGTDRWTRIKNELKAMQKNSFIEFEEDEEEWEMGFLIPKVRSTRKKIYVRFDSDYIPLLTELSGNYTKLLSNDLVTFDSKYSMMLYQNLMRLNCYSAHIEFTTKQLKDMFGLDEDAYVFDLKDKKTKKVIGQKFNRALFEKYTIDVAIKEINEKARCIQDLKYEKMYKGRQVACYSFSYIYSDPIREKEYQDAIIESEREEVREASKDRNIEPSTYAWWDEKD